jgi:hypothetical protein
MPTRLTRLDCYNRQRLFEYKGAARRLFVSCRRRHGAEYPGRVPGLPPQLHAEIVRDDAGADIAAARDRPRPDAWVRRDPPPFCAILVREPKERPYAARERTR